MKCIYGLFKTSLKTELGVYALQEKGFIGDRVRVVPLDTCVKGTSVLIDDMYKSDGLSLFDGMAFSGTVGMLFGVIFGSVLYVGSITVGLLGMILGAGLGYMIDKSIRKRDQRSNAIPSGEIIVSVECKSDEELATAESILREYQAVALGKFYTSIDVKVGQIRKRPAP
ncbi:hypothetical protein H1S01_04465 [Heliobacterium chlorum]|uniref:DUF1269 domain-containing protein n=1 Tax=Heliobacterium chlorum TaxID=2698 RepID=A0ABR7T0F5_HELCL|nr:hypothetical protein [Heliobacterium chlorum]MBC9783765.1 hypothetical protein [Heliobacterium chlorum]